MRAAPAAPALVAAAVAAAVVAAGAGAGVAAAADEGLRRFLGSYVGRAVEVGPDPQPSERDLDVVIGPGGAGGLVIDWVNVTLVDGRRDVPGVKRRADQVRLAPASGRGFYLAQAAYDPFSERREPDPLAGEPVRWATVEGDTVRTYSLVVLDDGRYEVQVYDRSLTDEGLDLDWRRIVDGEVVRRMTGRTVRAD